ncbi:MAG: SMC-Scp complex subunit ScpB [Candidatus Margulisbacteria bacterium]|nr:SMC-Scp complex subunit ScpB [Candidatus Margulisiibacteriota bacterium]
MENQSNNSQLCRVKTILESLLFVARKPLSFEELKKCFDQTEGSQGLNCSQEELEFLLEDLVTEYRARGINVVKVAGGYLMGTNPANADYVYSLLHARVQTTLSPQALETLSIIAYKQPVTQAEIEQVRGVNSDGPISTLLAKKLISDQGRSDAPGRPYIYGTTIEFLRHFGLKDLNDLPPLPSEPEEQEEVFKSALHE